MRVPRIAFVLSGLLVLVSCSGGSGAESSDTDAVAPSTTAPPTTMPVVATTAVTVAPPTTAPAPVCVVTVRAGDSLGAIVARLDGTITLQELLDENRLVEDDIIHPDDQLDVCAGNDVDDVTGASRLPPSPAAVRAQQRKLNELFDPYVIADLAVDGDSGPLTRQLLCAARLGLGLPASTRHLAEGSEEEATIFAATSLSIPAGAATWASKWILIDRTCQVIFTGEGEDRIVEVFPTSTGEPGYETRTVRAEAAYRFDPAVDNDGWHDSANFPSAVDDPLNGNMYKPLYFNGGQAIHGAGYIPPFPRSKGCARTFPYHQDLLLRWLGIDDLTEAVWNERAIGVTVTVQGDFRDVIPST